MAKKWPQAVDAKKVASATMAGGVAEKKIIVADNAKKAAKKAKK